MKASKKIITLIAILFFGIIISISCNKNEVKTKAEVTNETSNKTMQEMHHTTDKRISLGLSPEKKQHQLMNMRSHLASIQSVLNLISENNFKEASEVAHAKLGLTDEMKKMCTSFNNQDFVKLGLDFHKSADKLSEVLKTKDKDASLRALSTTISYCVNCHATFRQ